MLEFKTASKKAAIHTQIFKFVKHAIVKDKFAKDNMLRNDPTLALRCQII